MANFHLLQNVGITPTPLLDSALDSPETDPLNPPPSSKRCGWSNKTTCPCSSLSCMVTFCIVLGVLVFMLVVVCGCKMRWWRSLSAKYSYFVRLEASLRASKNPFYRFFGYLFVPFFSDPEEEHRQRERSERYRYQIRTRNMARLGISQNDAPPEPLPPIALHDVPEDAVEVDYVCPICLDESRQNLAGLPCGHYMHRDCIQDWLTHNDVCPLCKRKVRPEDPACSSSAQPVEVVVQQDAMQSNMIQYTQAQATIPHSGSHTEPHFDHQPVGESNEPAVHPLGVQGSQGFQHLSESPHRLQLSSRLDFMSPPEPVPPRLPGPVDVGMVAQPHAHGMYSVDLQVVQDKGAQVDYDQNLQGNA